MKPLLAILAPAAAAAFSVTAPAAFEQNLGQAGRELSFLTRSSGRQVALARRGSLIVAARGAARGRLVVRPAGARDVPAKGEGRLPGVRNVYAGNRPEGWTTGIPRFSRVRYRGVYPGVDLVYYGSQGRLEFDFLVAPGADAGGIRLRVGGHNGVRLDEKGDVLIRFDGDVVRLPRPKVYQEIEGGRNEVAASYRLDGDGIRLALGVYDRARQLVIDPVLVLSTHLGGAAADAANAIAVDGQGNIYVTGSTSSNDFVTLPTALGRRNYSDVFVTKLNPAGTEVLYSTILAGSGRESGHAIAVDAAGNAYIGGSAASQDFPVTPGALQREPGYAFVFKLDPSGRLAYATYLGGFYSWNDVRSIAVDGAGNAFAAGSTNDPRFPVRNPIHPYRGSDGFVAKINPAGTALLYSTFLGGAGTDAVRGIAIDSAGSALVTGETASSDFPVVNSLYPPPPRSPAEYSFVAKLSPAGTSLAYSTYVPGGLARGIAIDAAGNAYVTGTTSSKNLPLVRPIQDGLKGPRDAFAAKLNAQGTALVYSTYLGGSLFEDGVAIAADWSGSAYVLGSTWSGDFPVASPLQARFGGGRDGFLTQISPDGSALEFSTFLGGGGDDIEAPFLGLCGALALDRTGAVYVAGGTTSPDFPSTPGTVQPRYSGFPTAIDNAAGDAFVMKIEPRGAPSPPVLQSDRDYAISTVAGSGAGGFQGEGVPAVNTDLGSITALAVDGVNRVHIAGHYCYSFGVTPSGFPLGSDCSLGVIRRVAADGILEYVAGRASGPSFSGDGGPASKATFNYPRGMVFGPGGSLYFADIDNHRVRKIDADGTVRTVAGNGNGGFSGDGEAATAARLNSPSALAVDAQGAVYIGDSLNYRVRKVSAAGNITTVAGTGAQAGRGAGGDGGPAIYASFNRISGLAVDAGGNLFVSDDCRVRRITPGGTITTVAGLTSCGFNGDDRPALTAKLSDIRDILLDTAGNLFIADFGNNRVRKVDRSGAMTTIAGGSGAGRGGSGAAGDGEPGWAAPLTGPRALAMDAEGDIYVAEGGRVRKLAAPRAAPVFGADGVVHPATYLSGPVARGSLFTIFGAGLGPQREVRAERYPLTTRLADVQVKVTQGERTWEAPVVFVSPGQVNAILPSEVASGEAVLVLRRSGVPGSAVPVSVTDSRFEIFAAGVDSRQGLVYNLAADGQAVQNGPETPARPLQTVAAVGAGLGPVNAPDYLAPEPQDMALPVEVTVGGVPARVVYRGRFAGTAGVDAVRFEIPAGAPTGCEVTVAVSVGEAKSRVVTISLSSQGQPCR